jgi:hypothetical protein
MVALAALACIKAEAGVITLAELNGADRLRPDLMPIVNDEFDWIALTMADLD